MKASDDIARSSPLRRAGPPHMIPRWRGAPPVRGVYSEGRPRDTGSEEPGTMQARGPTAVWLGRLEEGGEGDLDRFVAELRQPDTIRRLRENYHLTAYRLEADGAPLRGTLSGGHPAALRHFPP